MRVRDGTPVLDWKWTGTLVRGDTTVTVTRTVNDHGWVSEEKTVTRKTGVKYWNYSCPKKEE